MARKRDKERDRVRKIGIEYQSLSEMLGLHPRKQNKVLTLKAALQFIVENYEGMTTLVPGVSVWNLFYVFINSLLFLSTSGTSHAIPSFVERFKLCCPNGKFGSEEHPVPFSVCPICHHI